MDILDSQIFTNKIPRMLINCHNKVQGKYTRFRAYSLYRMFWLKKNFKELTVKPQAYTKVKPNFRGLIRPLDSERVEAVDIISGRGKKEVLAGGDKNKLYDKYELANILGRSASYVQIRLQQLNVKPVKREKRRNL